MWLGGESIGAERRRASSLSVMPTGMDTAYCVGESVGSDGPSLVVQIGDPVSSGAAPASVGLNGVTNTWRCGSTAAPEKDEPVELRKLFFLRRRLMKTMDPATRIKAATPPAIPPAIAPVCDVAFDDVALTVIWTTGALRKWVIHQIKRQMLWHHERES